MKISVVTISFNQAKFLRQCIDSVLDQNFNNIEYIIVDPGSTDGSREIIESYGSRVLKIFAKDAGPADGLNAGFTNATGSIFGFLNADDELLPGALSRISSFFKDKNDVDVVSGCGYFTDETGVRLGRIISSRLTPWLYAHRGVTIFQQGTFFRANYFRKVGGFNATNHTCWDGELFLDMAIAGARFSTINNDLAHFRLHEGGITGSGRLGEKYQLDTKRLFIKATGRERNYFDRLQDIVARVVKGCIDPTYHVRRAISMTMSRKR